MKSTILGFFSVTILALCVSQSAMAGDVVIISNPGTTISITEVRDIFIGEKQFSGNTKLVVIDNKSLQSDFLAKFIKMDATKYNGIWTKKSFRDGLTPPAVKSGDAEVTEYVRQTPGAIGYVSKLPEGVNIAR